jgi:hypothetical protein
VPPRGIRSCCGLRSNQVGSGIVDERLGDEDCGIIDQRVYSSEALDGCADDSAMLPSTITIARSLATSLLLIERDGLIEELDDGEED